jgi:hypothetical protein
MSVIITALSRTPDTRLVATARQLPELLDNKVSLPQNKETNGASEDWPPSGNVLYNKGLRFLFSRCAFLPLMTLRFTPSLLKLPSVLDACSFGSPLRASDYKGPFTTVLILSTAAEVNGSFLKFDFKSKKCLSRWRSSLRPRWKHCLRK